MCLWLGGGGRWPGNARLGVMRWLRAAAADEQTEATVAGGRGCCVSARSVGDYGILVGAHGRAKSAVVN